MGVEFVQHDPNFDVDNQTPKLDLLDRDFTALAHTPV